jgi:hypothetical protein
MDLGAGEGLAHGLGRLGRSEGWLVCFGVLGRVRCFPQPFLAADYADTFGVRGSEGCRFSWVGC